LTSALTKGEALATRSGRADDFRWPRDAVNVEPAAAEPATRDTAASDADATSAKPTQRKSALDAYAAQTGRQPKPAQRRPRPRLNHNAWAHQRSNFPSFGASGW
jgi:hypothetical protein